MRCRKEEKEEKEEEELTTTSTTLKFDFRSRNLDLISVDFDGGN